MKTSGWTRGRGPSGLDTAPMSVNRAYGVGRKTMFKSKAYKEYDAIVSKALGEHSMPDEVKTGKLKIKFRFMFSRSNSDIDNPVKPLQDILQRHFGFDDKQVYRLEVEKYTYPGAKPWLEVENHSTSHRH